MEYLLSPWPWYVTGPLIALVMFLLLYFDKTFGMSSNLRTLCSMGGAGKYADFFRFNWKEQRWNLMVVVGAVIGGFIATHYLSNEQPIKLAAGTVADLHNLGFENAGHALVPDELFGISTPIRLKSIVLLAVAGLFVGFGTRYAGGCTSGHAITGLSSLQWPSLIAVIGFFLGGLVMIHFIFPFLF